MPPGVANQSPRRRETAGEQASPGRLAAFLDEHRAGLGAILVAIAAVGLGWAGWSRLGDRVRGAADLMLHPDSITVEGIAPWVRADLKSEALRDASLDAGIPLDDPELVRRLARAFAMHPWVREVVSVTATHPAAADVTAETAAEYPRITGVPSGPQGAVGFPWGDPLVEEGSAVAAAVGPDWKSLGLTGCRPAGGASQSPRAWELIDDKGRTVLFGAAPGHEAAGEPTAATKISRLRALPEGKSADLTKTPPPADEVRSIPAG